MPHTPGDTIASDALRVVPRVEARLAAGAAAAAVEGVAAAAVDARVHVRAGRATSVGGVATAAAAPLGLAPSPGRQSQGPRRSTSSDPASSCCRRGPCLCRALFLPW